MLAGGPSTLHASSHQVSSRYRLSDEAFCCMSVQLHARAGAGTSEGAVSCRGYVPKRPTILVVGNEGRGLRTAVERVCEGVLRINAAPSPGRIAPQGRGLPQCQRGHRHPAAPAAAAACSGA